ncbi:MAG: hypothetical protein RRB13_04210 [bacterium]|nr:hypothetical protein [bacterium]
MNSLFRPLLGLLIGVILLGSGGSCARAKLGKVDLEAGAPKFLTLGLTTEVDLLEQLGEPLGYRQQGNLSVMSYVDFREEYTYFFLGQYRKEEAYILYLSFRDGRLDRAEVKREGWGFDAQVDPQMLQIFAR